MKKNVILVNSMFNLLLAINLKNTLFEREEFDIIISDASYGLQEIYEKRVLHKTFDNVYYIELKKKRHFTAKLDQLFGFFSPAFVVKKILKVNTIPIYRDIFFWNPDNFFCNYIRLMNEKGYDYKLHLYADSMGGFTTDFPFHDLMYRSKIINKLNKYFFKFDYVKNLDYDYYLFSPWYLLVESKRQLIEIPKVDRTNEKLTNLLNDVFDYSNKYISEKFIFLDGAKDGFINEEEVENLIVQIVNTVGRENIIFKLHPRTPKDYYKKLDIKVMEDCIPWELYCLNNDVNDKIIITHSSSAAIMPNVLFGSKQTIYLWMDIINSSHPLMSEIRVLFEKIKNNGTNVVFFNNFNDMQTMLLKDVQENS